MPFDSAHGPDLNHFQTGLPSSALCMWGSSLANAALFALVLPSVRSPPPLTFLYELTNSFQYIIMAMHARPVPSNPYNPAPGSSSSSTAPPSSARYPSPFLPIRIPVFAPVLWLNDRVVGLLRLVGSLSTDPRKRLAGGDDDHRQKEFAFTAAYGKGRGRGRAMSDETVQSVEEGGGAEDTSGATRTRGLERERVVSGRFRVPRRKID